MFLHQLYLFYTHREKEMRKVRLVFVLVGNPRVGNDVFPKDCTNENLFNRVRKQVAEQFGDRAIVFVDEKRLKEITGFYPRFYAAGMFVGDPINSNTFSELILVAHGDTIKSSQKRLMDEVQNIDWDTVAKDYV